MGVFLKKRLASRVMVSRQQWRNAAIAARSRVLNTFICATDEIKSVLTQFFGNLFLNTFFYSFINVNVKVNLNMVHSSCLKVVAVEPSDELLAL